MSKIMVSQDVLLGLIKHFVNFRPMMPGSLVAATILSKLGEQGFNVTHELAHAVVNDDVEEANRLIEEELAKTVTISRKEHDELLAAAAKLHALESHGVDNWEWYGDAMQELEED